MINLSEEQVEGPLKITDGHFDHWLTHGYTVVENFVDGEQLTAAQEQVMRLMPIPEGMPYFSWPFPEGDALNELAVDPELIAFVQRGIGTRDIVCVLSGFRGKGGGSHDGDQSLHCDFGNNTLVYPRDDSGFRQIIMILYFFDVTEDLGPTAVVSRQLTDDLLPGQHVVSREQRPDLYEREVRVVVPAGSLLVYGMRTFHRGTAMTNPTGFRPNMWHVFQAADVPWRGPRAWDFDAMSPDMHRAITRMTPQQRELFGFPKIGHPYWNDETIEGVAVRYPEIDMSPYRAALSG